jgi:hypothetical protein
MLGMPESKVHFVYFDDNAKFHQEFAWWPCRCWITDRWLWLTHITVGIMTWSDGPSPSIMEKRYYDSAEYLIEKLKGTAR